MKEAVNCHKCNSAIMSKDLPYVVLGIAQGVYKWTGLCCMDETQTMNRYVEILDIFEDGDEISTKLLKRSKHA